ncbi:MAG TPA: hypothetical protein VEB18_01760 [Candidatus Paceibacterota bacterium]|nr:hypothetical protein [Candidatus Paceibacterota bacterium]
MNIFKKINSITGKLPLAGNEATRGVMREGIIREPDIEKRMKRMGFAMGFTSVMVIFHAFQADMGAEKGRELMEDSYEQFLQDGTIDTSDLSQEAAAAFAYIYALVNIMVVISQLYVAYRAVAGTRSLLEEKQRAFFAEIGIHPEGNSDVDTQKLVQYVLAAARGDKQKQDVLKIAVGEKPMRRLLDALTQSDQWDTLSMSYEEFEAIIDRLYKNQCPIYNTYPPGKPPRIGLRNAVELLVTGAAQAVMLSI